MDKHIAHVFRDDLEKLQNSECAVTVYSVEMRDPDRGETIPLVVADQPPPAPVAEELEPLYTHPQTAVPEQLTPDTAEHKLHKSGVFKGADGLRRLADADEFWESQSYGTRLYFGSGISDYLHRDVLRTAIKLLDSAPAKPAVPDVNALAEFVKNTYPISWEYGSHKLAKQICNWIEEQKNDQ